MEQLDTSVVDEVAADDDAGEERKKHCVAKGSTDTHQRISR